MPIRSLSAATLLFAASLAQSAAAQELTMEAIESAEFSGSEIASGERSPVIVKAQVLLDRTPFSPGVIDGYWGDNVSQAVEAFEKHHGLDADGQLDEEVWQKLTAADSKPVLTEYTISEDDVNGPFVETIPDDFKEMSKLDSLGYTSPDELLAEKFHMDQELLHALNPDADFGSAGTKIVVANPGEEKSAGKVARIEVDKSERALRAYSDEDELVAFNPATIGSEGNPAPDGTYEVRAIAEDPAYYYNPETLDFAGVDVDEQVKIAPGPNNPVGTIWIDLTKEGYGIHGTPEPDKIGKTFSHGCVRLTNWDALELAYLVESGTRVEFLE